MDVIFFIKKFYEENKKNYECIVDRDYIINKSKEFFYTGIWKNKKLTIDKKSYSFKGEILFGLKSGICFLEKEIIFLCSRDDFDTFSIGYFELEKYNLSNGDNQIIDWVLNNNLIKFENGRVKEFYDYVRYHEGGPGFRNMSISKIEVEFLFNFFKSFLKEVRREQNDEKTRIQIENELKNNILNQKKNILINSLDLDNNGEVDLVDGDSFNKLLNKNQKNIIELDKNYIQKFVKISMYLKTKKSNTQKIFDSIKDTKNENELNELVNLLKNQIHTYELLVFHSISMITSLVESDLITFYEIYECFDQLGVFNSNWENEVSNKLTDIGDRIKDLMYSINQMENKIVNSINNLTYVTQDSFKELNISVKNQLSSIDSSIKFNNLLTGIQTYQMYKINQNTKRIG